MSKRDHRPMCHTCGVRPCKKNPPSKVAGGKGKWRYECNQCHKGNRNPRLKGRTCEACGFVPVHQSQLDVDHIDGDRKNNNASNLQTLCANCHRLKTYLNRDYLPASERKQATLQLVIDWDV